MGTKYTMRPALHVKRAAAFCTALALAIGTVTPAWPAEIEWRTKTFQIAAEGKPLVDVLRDFAAAQGMLVSVAPEVEGSVSVRFNGSPDRFLNLMALSYGFTWYYNGAVLQISAAKGMKSTLVTMSAARVKQLQLALERMKLLDLRFPIRYDEDAGAALVSGPQDYVDLVREVAAQLDRKQAATGLAETRVFKLRYAWAADRPGNTGEPALPGVASTLNAMYQQRKGPVIGSLPIGRRGVQGLPQPSSAGGAKANDPIVPAGARPENRTLANWFQDMRNGGPQAGTQGLTVDDRQNGGGGGGGNGGRSDASHEENLPVILADPANNSVIVRDLPERMADHEEMIRTLDHKPQMVEIEVQIIEVDQNSLDELGVDWRLHTSRVDAQSIGPGQAGLDASQGPVGPGGTPLTPGGVVDALAGRTGNALTVVLGNSGRYLLSRVSALEQRDRARVVARPKVATLNNVEALMDSKQTYQVRVAGQQSAELFSVSAGISLRVMPTVSDEGNDPHIRLGVHVEDGRFLAERIDGMPVTTSSRLDTQAIVKHGESLLIAGYATERNSTGRSGIPVLSSIPVVGGLFRTTATNETKFERLFLVTPRVLE